MVELMLSMNEALGSKPDTHTHTHANTILSCLKNAKAVIEVTGYCRPLVSP